MPPAHDAVTAGKIDMLQQENEFLKTVYNNNSGFKVQFRQVLCDRNWTDGSKRLRICSKNTAMR